MDHPLACTDGVQIAEVEAPEFTEHQTTVLNRNGLRAAENGRDDVPVGVQSPGWKLVTELSRIADVDGAGVKILVLVPRRRGDLRQDVQRVLEDVLSAVVGGVLGLLLEEDAAARVLRVGDRQAIS